MKSVFKKIVIVVLMLGTLTGYANDNKKINSTFTYLKKGNHISVYDASGDVIYSGQINNDGSLTTLYDFSQLKNGKYIVEVSKDFEIEINTVEVINNKVAILNTDQKTIHKPVVRNQNATVLISKLALNANKMIVELYYEDELIHKETLEGAKILNRVYKLDKTLSGKYTAIIKSDDRVFVENFRI
jgi:hypothetical protein